jgi:hypothetical protein
MADNIVPKALAQVNNLLFLFSNKIKSKNGIFYRTEADEVLSSFIKCCAR